MAGQGKKKTVATRWSEFYKDGKWLVEGIPEPTAALVEEWSAEWGKLPGYPKRETALDKLFGSLCRTNTDLDDILIKVSALNDFYSTNIYQVAEVAQIIFEMEIDKRLKAPDFSLVQDLSKKAKARTGRSIYSFATKYCSHHFPEVFPICDYYVEKMLCYYRDKYPKFKNAEPFADSDLRDYEKFCKIIRAFQKCFDLGESIKEIDKMLWQLGKKYFPKYREVAESKAESK